MHDAWWCDLRVHVKVGRKVQVRCQHMFLIYSRWPILDCWYGGHRRTIAWDPSSRVKMILKHSRAFISLLPSYFSLPRPKELSVDFKVVQKYLIIPTFRTKRRQEVMVEMKKTYWRLATKKMDLLLQSGGHKRQSSSSSCLRDPYPILYPWYLVPILPVVMHFLSYPSHSLSLN